MTTPCLDYINKHNFGPDTKIWNAWRGCRKISEGCKNCYVQPANTFIDIYEGMDLSDCRPGQVITLTLFSDFFLAEADPLRPSVWAKIKKYKNLIFVIVTKRVQRIQQCLPSDWGDGYDNVVICATAENQKRADQRLPLFLKLPIKHKWITCSPMLEPIDLSEYLKTGEIEHVECTGERCSEGITQIRPTKYAWVHDLAQQCVAANVRFTMQYLGHNFEMPDGEIQKDHSKWFRSKPGEDLNLNYYKPITFKLKDLEITY